MDPSASEWKPSATAACWAPPSATPAASAEAPATAETPVTAEDEDPLLWDAVLKIANGDRSKAEKLLNDPDQLAVYPEISALLMGTSPASDSNACSQHDVDEPPPQPEQVEAEAETLRQATDAVSKLTVQDNSTSNAPASSPNKADNTAPAPTATSATAAQDATTLAASNEPLVQQGDPREHLNLVFIGHVDAGKSTLSGNILYLTDNVDKRTVERFEREAKERNRESWFLAFIMDTNEEERQKGKTVEVGKAHFETPKTRYTILDAPGHKNYVPHMIQGASQADVGVLVLSARKGEFETGFDKGGQTREHAMLAKTLGVSYLVVCVNKMDEATVQWSKQRFDECVTKIRPFLKSCGFVIKTQVKFIPISGLGGANVLEAVDPKECSWWAESVAAGENNTRHATLISLLDNLELSGRDASAALRIPVLDRYTDRGTIAMGKVESGLLRPGMKVTVMPTRNEYKVDEVWINDTDPVAAARPGENVLVKLANAKLEDIRKGFVLCTEPLCRAVDKLICQIAIADMPENQKILTAGFQCMFHAHTTEEECTITKIFETTNSKGHVTKGARFASVGMRAIVMVELSQTVPVDTYDSMAFLGRFTLRTEGKTIAIGKINKLPPKRD